MKSLRGKLIRLLLVMTAVVSVPTALVVGSTKINSSERHLRATEEQLKQAILDTGRVLTQSHAQALERLTLDNAFADMQALVTKAVTENSQLVYGVYVARDGSTLAFAQQGEENQALPLPPNGWNLVGLSSDSYHVDRLAQRDAMVLGANVLETAVPVLDEESGQPPIGTLRYGFSTAGVDQAISAARREADEELRRALIQLTALFVAAGIVGLMIGRRQAVHIAEPLGELTRAASRLAAGDRTVSVQISSDDEVEALGTSFNQMVKELNSSYGQLEVLNRDLEARVRERTAALHRMNQEMRAVLDGVDEGLVMLSAEARVVGTPSAAAVAWFGAPGSDPSFTEYLSATSEQFAEMFDLGWEQVTAGFLPLSVTIAQLPSRIDGERSYAFRYIPLLAGEHLDGLLVVVTDITDAVERERAETQQRDLLGAFRALTLDRDGFRVFAAETTETIRHIVAGDLSIEALRHELHTLKGNAASLGMMGIANVCHELEEHVAEGTFSASDALARLETAWMTLTQQLGELRRDDVDDVVVAAVEHQGAVRQLEQLGVDAKAIRRIESWKLRPVAKDFTRLAEQARALARRLGKGDVDVEVSVSDIRLDPATWSPLLSSMIHVIRNAVDHGIEPTEERDRAGKSHEPRLCLRCYTRANEMLIEVEDDGRGIDAELLKRRRSEFGLSADASIVDLMCHAGVTTRTHATAVSGRGIGMAAVRKATDHLGGTISVESSTGVGTKWTFTFSVAPVDRTFWVDTHTPLQRASA